MASKESFFLAGHTAMAIDTFHHTQLVARPFLNADSSLPFNQSLDGDMAVFALDLLDLLPMMAFCTGFLNCLPVIFPRRMTIRTFHPIASHMGLMRKFDIVKGDRTFFYPHMAEGGTGHLGLKFSGV